MNTPTKNWFLKAYLFLRKNNQDIPDEILEQIKNLEQIKKERDAYYLLLEDIDKMRCSADEVTGTGGYYKINSQKLDAIFRGNPLDRLNK